MRSFHGARFRVLLSVAACALAASTFVRAADLVDETPQRWFVELSNAPTADGGNPAAVANDHANFRSQAAAAGLRYSVRYSYSSLFNGFSVNIAPGDVAKLSTMPGVKSVHMVRDVPLPMTTPGDNASQPDWLSMTGADYVQNELGFKGDGITVAVMDTGVDYNHPDLGGCFGPGCKVEKGYDLVGDAFNNTTIPTPTPDPYPMDCAGHGTHVSGIVAADGQGQPGHVTGVAPHVKLHMYRVFGCSGSTSDDIMLAAMEMILADGADVLSMSIGSDFDDWKESPTAAGSDRLARKGIVVVAAAGNAGASGTYTTGSPSTGTRVISVASFENLSIAQPAFIVNGTLYGYNPAAAAPLAPKSGSAPLKAAPDTIGCAAPPANFYSGTIAFIKRGTCTFSAKAAKAQAAGALAVVLYNNQPGALNPTVAGGPAITIPVVAVTQSDGTAIASAMPTTLTWSDQVSTRPNPTAGLVSTFSSFGPTAELDFKPDIGAPGGNIWSTYPLALGGYATLSGTSMATPHIAGSVALLLQARPHLPANGVRDLLQNNAVPANWNGNPSLGFLDNVTVQGAGLAHIDRTILNKVSVAPGKIAIGDASSGPSTQTLTFTNNDSVPVTYNLSDTPALATGPVEFPPVGEYGAFASVVFSSPSVTVPAGGTASVNATITAPAGDSLYVYGGYLVATPVGGAMAVRVPYMGVTGNYQDMQMIPAGLPFLSHRNFAPVTNGAVFNLSAGDIPTIAVQLTNSARNLTAEVYATDDGTTLGRDWHKAFSYDYVPRNTSPTGAYLLPFDGTTFNGNKLNTLPAGKYVIVFTALQPLGDPSNPASVEKWQSPMFELKR